MRKKLIYILLSTVLGIVVLVNIDKYAVKKATALLMADDSPIYERVDPTVIDWDGPKVQSCEFGWIWKIYPYQTCYRRGHSKVIKGDFFVFALTGPPPYFSPFASLLGGRTPTSYRFTLPVQTYTRFVFYPDGTVTDLGGEDDTEN